MTDPIPDVPEHLKTHPKARKQARHSTPRSIAFDARSDPALADGEPHDGPTLVPISEILARKVISDPLIQGVMDRNSLVSLFGETGTGKTFIALDWALSVAIPGDDWHGSRVHNGAVVYLAAENAEGVARRIQAYRTVHPEADLAAFDLIEEPVDMPSPVATSLLIRNIKRRFDRATELVVIDTADACMGVADDSSTAGMRAYIDACKTIRRELNCTVLCVMHPGHDNIDRERGGSNLKAAMDFRYKATVHSVGFQVTNLKVKNGALYPPTVLQSRVVELGDDAFGDPITSFVLARSSDAPIAATKGAGKQRMSDASRICADVLTHMTNVRNAIDVFDARTVRETTLTLMTKVALIDDWRAECYRRGITDSSEPEARKKAFQRAKAALQSANWVGELDGYAWRIRPKK